MPEKRHIAIIGKGNVGSNLRQGLERIGHNVDAVGREPDQVRTVAKEADIVFLAVPFAERKSALEEAGLENIKGKVLVDVTNALGDDGNLAIDPRKESGGEQVQEMASGARVVKAFNTVFAERMEQGIVDGEPLSIFVASDDNEARETVMEIARDLSFDPVDAGNLENARWLETLAMFNMALGYKVNHGTDIGFRLVRPGSKTVKRGEQVAREQ